VANDARLVLVASAWSAVMGNAREKLLQGLQIDMRELFNFYKSTQGRCMQVVEPCSAMTCRYHLHGDAKPCQIAMAPAPIVTCSLKLANEGPMILDEIGMSMGLTRERVRQIEGSALAHLHRNMKAMKLLGEKFHDLPGD
jgi:hypothetical protein